MIYELTKKTQSDCVFFMLLLYHLRLQEDNISIDQQGI